MISDCSVRRYMPVFLFFAAAGLLPRVYGQQRIAARVVPNAGSVNNLAETFDQGSSGFNTVAGVMTTAREGHTAVRLPDGKVFVVGGYNGAYLASAEIFDPTTRQFTASANVMAAARSSHTATLLQDGRVFIAGGWDGNTFYNTAEIYDPASDTFTTTTNSLTSSRKGHTATLLSNGKVLLVGGYNGSYLTSAELFDPVAGTFTATTGQLGVGRSDHTATLLSDGKVLIAGGQNGVYLDSAEVYDPTTGSFTTVSNAMSAKRLGHTATLISGGKVLITGGNNTSYLDVADIYDPSSGKFAATSGKMTALRSGHAAAPLPNGSVLITGGYNGVYLRSAEIFDPSSGTFAALPGAMSTARYLHSATVLLNGQILLAGGRNNKLLLFDTNVSQSDNISPNILFSSDSQTGYVAYSGSGVVLAFSVQTGAIIASIQTGGAPFYGTPLSDGQTIAYPSATTVLNGIEFVTENRIFLIDTKNLQLKTTYTFNNAIFGFGSILTLSPDGSIGYISSPGTGEVIKFNVSTGKELGRLTGLQAPQQITVSKDGSLIIVVDAQATQLIFADSGTMTSKFTFKPRDKISTATLSIFSKAVLAPDGTTGIIVCDDATLTYNGTAFIFKTATGDIVDTETVGTAPGFTGITPNGENWVVFNSSSISLIPTYDPAAKQELTLAKGDSLGSANIVFSPDSTYAYYAASAHDYVYQHNLSTGGVVGQVLVGDDPNRRLDQPAGIAITPDGNRVAVLEFISNEIDILAPVTTLEAPKFIISGNQFTGLSLINLSNVLTKFTLTALDNYGQVITADGLTNPVELNLPPNAQISKNVSELFTFDISTEHIGRLSVAADQPQIAGYMSMGTIIATWFGYYLNQMDGAPLFRDQLSDWVVPEVHTDSGQHTTLDFTSANYTQETYDVRLYSRDGTLSQEKTGNVAYPTNRLEQQFSDLFTIAGQNKVLMIGGSSSGTTIGTAELYDVGAKTFSTTGSLNTPRQGHTATLLFNGKVLVAGGKNGSTILSSAETYDIGAGTFTTTPGTMTVERNRHTATLLASGKVLLAGGQNSTSVNDTAEVYDPSNNSFTATAGHMTAPRDGHTATLLASGKVLITGGINGNVVSNTAELYDPATGQFKATGSMASSRAFHTATTLSNGRVLIAGGYNGSYLNTAEIYDPATEAFSPTSGSMVSHRDNHTATLMADGRVLIAGGTDSSGTFQSAEIYDPSTNSFSGVAGAMSAPRTGHTATLLPEVNSIQDVLIAGGSNSTGDLSSADLYSPSNQSFTATGSLTGARSGHTATLLVSGGQGYLRVTCKGGLLNTEYFGTGTGSGMMNGIDVSKFIGVKSLYAPQFANTPGFKSYLNLINANTDADATVTIILHDPNGRILGTPLTAVIPTNGQIRYDINILFDFDPAIQNATGWVEIQSNVDRVVGTISFTNDNNDFLTTFALSGTPLSHFVFPMAAEDSTYETGIALLNTNDQAANVTLELWGPLGHLDRTSNITIAPHAHTALYLAGYFPNLIPRLVGNIRVRSDKPLHSLGLVNDRDYHFIAAVPPIPFPEQ